jgi:DNA-binding transcriptional ArsR family regulator
MPLELDAALMGASMFHPDAALPEEIAALARTVPADWLEQWPGFLGEPRDSVSVLSNAADLAGVLLEEDYSRATLAIRELTQADALAGLAARVEGQGLLPDPALPPAERLADLTLRVDRALRTAVGLWPPGECAADEFRRTVRILKDGDLHDRFWHWLDRFYYECYQPWRKTRAEAMATLEERAVTALGAPAMIGQPPRTDWLHPQSPLRYLELQSAVAGGQFQACFWVEPFGLFDTWTLVPRRIVLSFAEPGALFANFRARAGEIAQQARALADPTRLMVLRIIRHRGMDNTQMADYLGLARPTVSIHAKVLREAGLIETRQEGREARHTLKPAAVRKLLRDLIKYLDLPDEQE